MRGVRPGQAVFKYLTSGDGGNVRCQSRQGASHNHGARIHSMIGDGGQMEEDTTYRVQQETGLGDGVDVVGDTEAGLGPR